jgi:hypothetical protein
LGYPIYITSTVKVVLRNLLAACDNGALHLHFALLTTLHGFWSRSPLVGRGCSPCPISSTASVASPAASSNATEVLTVHPSAQTARLLSWALLPTVMLCPPLWRAPPTRPHALGLRNSLGSRTSCASLARPACGGINPRYHKMVHGPHHLRWPGP